MRGRGIASLVLLLACCSGCGGMRAYQRELLERDLRWQEDELYRVTSENEQLCRQLDACQRENESLREELSQRRTSSGSSPSSSRDEYLESPAQSSPDVDLGDPTDQPPDHFQPGTESGAPNDFGPPQVDPLPPDAQPYELPPPGDGNQADERSAGAGPVVERITLNRMLTGGHNRDARFGDEGLLVMVEPRDPSDQIVPVQGSLSFVLVDPAVPGQAGRVARWDYSAAEVRGHFKQGVFGKGLRFELPWPGPPPQHENLKLFVRLTTSRGQRLQVESPIMVEVAPRRSHEWAATSPTTVDSDSGPSPSAEFPVNEFPVSQAADEPSPPALGDGAEGVAGPAESMAQSSRDLPPGETSGEAPAWTAAPPLPDQQPLSADERALAEAQATGDPSQGEAPSADDRAQAEESLPAEGALAEADGGGDIPRAHLERPRAVRSPQRVGGRRGTPPASADAGRPSRRGWAPYR